jgi:hypothetical protein
MYAAAVICLAGCGKQEDAKGNSSGNPITAPVDYLGAVNQARKGAVNTVDQAGLSKSIELFNVQEGRYPNDLKELSQKGYIHGEPSPPQGMQFQYDSKSGQLKIIPK